MILQGYINSDLWLLKNGLVKIIFLKGDELFEKLEVELELELELNF